MARQMVQHGVHYIMAYKLNPGSAFRASFTVLQGVGQCCILSTHDYKTYINDLLNELTCTHLRYVYRGSHMRR